VTNNVVRSAYCNNPPGGHNLCAKKIIDAQWQTTWAVPKQSLLVYSCFNEKGTEKGTVICAEFYTILEKERNVQQYWKSWPIYAKNAPCTHEWHLWNNKLLFKNLIRIMLPIERYGWESITKPSREWYEPWTLRRTSHHAYYIIRHNGVFYKLAWDARFPRLQMVLCLNPLYILTAPVPRERGKKGNAVFKLKLGVEYRLPERYHIFSHCLTAIRNFPMMNARWMRDKCEMDEVMYNEKCTSLYIVPLVTRNAPMYIYGGAIRRSADKMRRMHFACHQIFREHEMYSQYFLEREITWNMHEEECDATRRRRSLLVNYGIRRRTQVRDVMLSVFGSWILDLVPFTFLNTLIIKLLPSQSLKCYLPDVRRTYCGHTHINCLSYYTKEHPPPFNLQELVTTRTRSFTRALT
jgi:hypothetical protein